MANHKNISLKTSKEESFYDAIFKISNSQILSLSNMDLSIEYQRFINTVANDMQNFILKIKELCPQAKGSFSSIGNLGSVSIYSLAQSHKLEKDKEIYIIQRLFNLITSAYVIISGLILEVSNNNIIKYSLLYHYYNYICCLLYAFIIFVSNIDNIIMSPKLSTDEKNFLLIHDFIYGISCNLLKYGNKPPYEIHDNLFILSRLSFESIIYLNGDSNNFKKNINNIISKIIISIKKYTCINNEKINIPRLL